MNKYGDTHNFGRYVMPIGKNWILKPRSTFWEQLFLDGDSKFRDELEQILGDEPIMNCMPRLTFKKWKNDSSYTLMERITVKPIIKSCDLEYVLEALGGLLAIASWFGIEDLHRSNIFFGTDVRTGKFLMSPVDIEVIFNDLRLPSTMGIIHIDQQRQGIAGAAAMFDLIRSAGPKESLAIVCAYMRTSHKLLSNAARIVHSINATKGISSAPIRVLVRNTQDYVTYMNQGPRSSLIDPSALSDDELVQTRRGDVPYFFRTINDRRTRYFMTPDLGKSAYIKSQAWASRRAKDTLVPEKIFTIRNRNKLLSEDGPMMLAAYFLPKDFLGEIRYRNFLLAATKRAVHIQYNNGILFKGARNWSDYLVAL